MPEYTPAEAMLAMQRRELLRLALAGDWEAWQRVRNEMPRQDWMTEGEDQYGPAFSEADAPLVSHRVLWSVK